MASHTVPKSHRWISRAYLKETFHGTTLRDCTWRSGGHPQLLRVISQAIEVDYLYEAKMVLVGRGFAGKTSLVRKLTSPDYDLESQISSGAALRLRNG